MKSPRILLIGIGGVYNYGCEAIVRGTEFVIKRKYPEAKVYYATPRVVDDKRRLNGLDIKVVFLKKHGRYSLVNIVRKLLSWVGLKWDLRYASLNLLRNVDAVLSIGGDIYTLDSSGGYSLSLLKFGNSARRRGIPYILWGSSVGPFSANVKAEELFAKHLRKVALITAREIDTVNYLSTLGISDNVLQCADPAYLVASEIKTGRARNSKEMWIAINLSPLSIRYTEHSIEEAINLQARKIEGLIRNLGAHVVLVPHVISEINEIDDDLRYLHRIKNAISDECLEYLTLIDSDKGFIEIKKEIVKCDIAIAARMHCGINAISALVPTILLSYSQKSLGMADYVYRNRDWVISIEDFCKDNILENLIESMMAQRSEIYEYLQLRLPEIREDALKPLKRLSLILEG